MILVTASILAQSTLYYLPQIQAWYSLYNNYELQKPSNCHNFYPIGFIFSKHAIQRCTYKRVILFCVLTLLDSSFNVFK